MFTNVLFQPLLERSRIKVVLTLNYDMTTRTFPSGIETWMGRSLHDHQQTPAYSFCLQPVHPTLGTHTFAKRTEPGDAEAFSHIMEH